MWPQHRLCCLSLRSQAKRLQIVKVKAQDNYDSLDLSLLWESGYGLKKKDIGTPLSPTVLSESSSVLCLQFQGISLTLSHLLPTTVQLFEIWGIYCSVWLSYSTLFYKTINASMKNVEAFWRMVHGGFRRANWTLKWRQGLIKIPGISPRWQLLTYDIKPCRNWQCNTIQARSCIGGFSCSSITKPRQLIWQVTLKKNILCTKKNQLTLIYTIPNHNLWYRQHVRIVHWNQTLC